ncbi:hypothetical protein DL96DRAFT_1806301 [Flagelloscypha sp. PMI_526]|nr:hypothetical protein DL96DRAFT_1806301 [Flagelloscypha sp. PMI_526]
MLFFPFSPIPWKPGSCFNYQIPDLGFLVGWEPSNWKTRYLQLLQLKAVKSAGTQALSPSGAPLPSENFNKLQGTYSNAGCGKTELCYVAPNSSVSSDPCKERLSKTNAAFMESTDARVCCKAWISVHFTMDSISLEWVCVWYNRFAFRACAAELELSIKIGFAIGGGFWGGGSSEKEPPGSTPPGEADVWCIQANDEAALRLSCSWVFCSVAIMAMIAGLLYRGKKGRNGVHVLFVSLISVRLLFFKYSFISPI